MKLLNIIQRATDFGTFRSRKHFFSFTLKCIFRMPMKYSTKYYLYIIQIIYKYINEWI